MARMDSDVPHDENAELMRKTAGGDFDAFQQLYAGLAPALSRFLAKRGAKPHLCDELVQKIFADLWEKRVHFRAQSSFEAYLFGVARNMLRRELRQSRRIAEKGSNARPERPHELYDDLSEPEAELYLEELQAALQEAVDKLTPAERQALDVYRAEDSPSGKTPEVLRCSHRAFNNRLRRARKRLRELLSSILGGES